MSAQVSGESSLMLAERYLRQGLSPIPIPYKTKAPKILGWQKLRITTEEGLRDHFNGTRINVGTLTGIQGISDVDIDWIKVRPIANIFLPETGFSWGRKSKPASHSIYRTDPQDTRSKKYIDPFNSDEEGATIIELRALKQDGTVGMQSLLPGSRHPSGEEYVFEPNATELIQTVDQDVLETAVANIAGTALLAKYFAPNGSWNEAFLALAGIWARAGKTVEEATRFNWGIYLYIWGHEAIREQCRSEVAATYAKHERGENLTGIPKLKNLMREPRAVDVAFGWMNIHTPIEAAQRAVNGSAQSESHISTATRKLLLPEVLTVEDLLSRELPEAQPIIESLLYPGLTMCVGRPKTGKSWWALQVAVAVTSGNSLAGNFRVRKPGRVLYLALEESQIRTASRIRKLCPVTPDGIQDFKLVYSIDSLQKTGAAQLDGLLKENPTDVLIIDTLLAFSRAAGRSNDIVRNDYAEMHIFSEIAKAHKCAILLIHHSRKDSVNHDDVDAIIGTSGTSAAVDAIWHLKRGKANDSVLLSTVGRELEREQYEFRFDLSQGGHLFVASGEDVNKSAEQRAILELLENSDQPMSPEAIARDLKKNPSTTRRLISKLYQDSLISKSMNGKYFVSTSAANGPIQ